MGNLLRFGVGFLGNAHFAHCVFLKFFENFSFVFSFFWAAIKAISRFCVKLWFLRTKYAQKPCLTEVFVRRDLVFLKISVVRGSNIWGGFEGFTELVS